MYITEHTLNKIQMFDYNRGKFLSLSYRIENLNNLNIVVCDMSTNIRVRIGTTNYDGIEIFPV